MKYDLVVVGGGPGQADGAGDPPCLVLLSPGPYNSAEVPTITHVYVESQEFPATDVLQFLRSRVGAAR